MFVLKYANTATQRRFNKESTMKPMISQPIVFVLIALMLACCRASTIGTSPADLGTPKTLTELEKALAQPGKIVFEKHLAANWSVPLSGLLNLDHPKSQAAGLSDKEEAIQLYVYSIKHPEFGTYLVDSGVAAGFADESADNGVSWLVKSAMNMSALNVRKSTAQLVQELGGVDGAFLTHIHMDHIMGVSDLRGASIYGGPGDAELSTFMNLFTQGSTDSMFRNTQTLLEWQFGEEGIVDVFGDGSFWALHSPGHTPGATAYLAITTQGPELMIGDATHTRWGWENGVEPGTYSEDIPLSATSLATLKQFAESNPSVNVHPGHQSLR
ncbi:MAG: N-acyl homoserine lactone hydrolase [Pseudohongiellaceae bacterium]|jgi:N-acyl homoserine lactone hydrolase